MLKISRSQQSLIVRLTVQKHNYVRLLGRTHMNPTYADDKHYWWPVWAGQRKFWCTDSCHTLVASIPPLSLLWSATNHNESLEIDCSMIFFSENDNYSDRCIGIQVFFQCLRNVRHIFQWLSSESLQFLIYHTYQCRRNFTYKFWDKNINYNVIGALTYRS